MMPTSRTTSFVIIAAAAAAALAAIHSSAVAQTPDREPRTRVTIGEPAPPPRFKAKRNKEAINISIPKSADGLTTKSVPERYRLLSLPELKKELAELKKAHDEATTPSQRADIEDLIHLLELRISTGVDASALIEQLSKTTAELRGLDLLQPVRFRVLDGPELKEFLQEKIARELPPDYLPNQEFVLKLLGSISEDTDLQKTLLALLSEQVAGLYDEDTKLLYVMKQFEIDRALGRIILAHEICHAIQDQHFKISELPLNAPDNDDLSLATSAILEGDATILMQDYMRDSLGRKDLLQLVDILKIDQKALGKAPHILRQHLTFPYLAGATFMTELTIANPHRRDDVLRQPPRSTEQILHPEKFFSADVDEPTSFALTDLSRAFGKGWKRISTNVMGEFQIRTIFESLRDWENSKVASQGWDGDRYGLYRNGNSYAFIWASIWDTENDADEFFRMISDFLKDRAHKRFFADKPFEGDVYIRQISFSNVSKEQFHMRFRRSGRKALVEITNSGDVLDKAPPLDEVLFANIDGEVVPLPEMTADSQRPTTATATSETTTTASATTETQETLPERYELP